MPHAAFGPEIRKRAREAKSSRCTLHSLAFFSRAGTPIQKMKFSLLWKKETERVYPLFFTTGRNPEDTTKMNAIAKIYLLLFGIMASIPARSVDVPVPSSQEIVSKSDVILLVKLGRHRNGHFCGTVKEVIKGNRDLLEKSVQIISPYPEVSFPLSSWGKESLDKSILILGKWNERDYSVSLIFGTASFWPKGAPGDGFSGKDISDCIIYARKHAGRDEPVNGHEWLPMKSRADDRNLKSRAEKLVVALIAAAQSREPMAKVDYADWKTLSKQKRHAITPEKLKTLFADVKLGSIQFQDGLYGRSNDVFLLRMIEPLRLDFEFSRDPKDPDKLRIIGLHP